jgi:hypothetical protein
MYITAQLDAPAPAAAALKRFVCVTVHLVSTPPAEYPRFPARKTVLVFEFSLCLSRAWLGKMFGFIHKRLNKTGFTHQASPDPPA